MGRSRGKWIYINLVQTESFIAHLKQLVYLGSIIDKKAGIGRLQHDNQLDKMHQAFQLISLTKLELKACPVMQLHGKYGIFLNDSVFPNPTILSSYH